MWLVPKRRWKGRTEGSLRHTVIPSARGEYSEKLLTPSLFWRSTERCGTTLRTTLQQLRTSRELVAARVETDFAAPADPVTRWVPCHFLGKEKNPCVARFSWVTRQTEQFGARRAEARGANWRRGARCAVCGWVRRTSGGQSGTKPALCRCSVGPTFAATSPNTFTEQDNSRLRLPLQEFRGPNLPMLPTKRQQKGARHRLLPGVVHGRLVERRAVRANDIRNDATCPVGASAFHPEPLNFS